MLSPAKCSPKAFAAAISDYAFSCGNCSSGFSQTGTGGDIADLFVHLRETHDAQQRIGFEYNIPVALATVCQQSRGVGIGGGGSSSPHDCVKAFLHSLANRPRVYREQFLIEKASRIAAAEALQIAEDKATTLRSSFVKVLAELSARKIAEIALNDEITQLRSQGRLRVENADDIQIKLAALVSALQSQGYVGTSSPPPPRPGPPTVIVTDASPIPTERVTPVAGGRPGSQADGAKKEVRRSRLSGSPSLTLREGPLPQPARRNSPASSRGGAGGRYGGSGRGDGGGGVGGGRGGWGAHGGGGGSGGRVTQANSINASERRSKVRADGKKGGRSARSRSPMTLSSFLKSHR